MQHQRVRRFFSLLRRTPFHPQWVVFAQEERGLRQIGECTRGVVLDIGCADQKPRGFLPAGCRYVGLDYFTTATQWYGTRPDVFGDAQALPVADGAIDTALLLDVLEHLPRPDDCLREIHRVLKPGGTLVLQVPFLYPIHDAPLDFHRWTIHGFHRLAEAHGFIPTSELPLGAPLESAALLVSIAMSKTALSWIRQRNPLAVLTVLLPLGVLVTNVLAWAATRLSPADAFMASSYRLVWVKAAD